MNREELKLIQKEVDEALFSARSQKIEGAINWGDLFCVEVCRCENQDGVETIKVFIEEADPNNPELIGYVSSWLDTQSRVQIIEDIEVYTEW